MFKLNIATNRASLTARSDYWHVEQTHTIWYETVIFLLMVFAILPSWFSTDFELRMDGTDHVASN